jgi:hypothetical protein
MSLGVRTWATALLVFDMCLMRSAHHSQNRLPILVVQPRLHLFRYAPRSPHIINQAHIARELPPIMHKGTLWVAASFYGVTALLDLGER